jgi:hypothetical protein
MVGYGSSRVSLELQSNAIRSICQGGSMTITSNLPTGSWSPHKGGGRTETPREPCDDRDDPRRRGAGPKEVVMRYCSQHTAFLKSKQGCFHAWNVKISLAASFEHNAWYRTGLAMIVEAFSAPDWISAEQFFRGDDGRHFRTARAGKGRVIVCCQLRFSSGNLRRLILLCCIFHTTRP